MSFWNKNKLPAEYKDLTEDQIAELLNKGKIAEGSVTTTAEELRLAKERETKLASDLQAEKDRNAELARAAAASGERGGGGGGGGGGGQPTGPQGPPDATDWLTDPNASFNRSIAPTTAIALHGAIMSARLLADQFIRTQGPVNGRLWNKYSKEVEAIVNGLPPDQRIIPQTWINQFTYVKGIHLDDVVKEAQGAGDAFFSESATSSGSGMPITQTKDDNKLTDQEVAIAKRYGRTPDQYLASKKKLTVQQG